MSHLPARAASIVDVLVDTHARILGCVDTHARILGCVDTHARILGCVDTHARILGCVDTHARILGCVHTSAATELCAEHLDVIRCPDCHHHHLAGHEPTRCPVCDVQLVDHVEPWSDLRGLLRVNPASLDGTGTFAIRGTITFQTCESCDPT